MVQETRDNAGLLTRHLLYKTIMRCKDIFPRPLGQGQVPGDATLMEAQSRRNLSGENGQEIDFSPNDGDLPFPLSLGSSPHSKQHLTCVVFK